LLAIAIAVAVHAVSAACAAPGSARLDSLKAALAGQANGEFRPLPAYGFADGDSASLLIQWDRLRRAEYPATFSELSAFLRSHPGWPSENELRRRAEGMIDDLTPMAQRLSFFRAFPPLSAGGRFRHAEALQASGLTQQANEEARQAWRSGGISIALEPQFLARFGGALQPADHAARADSLLWDESITAAEHVGQFLTGEDKAIVDARVALQRAASARGPAAQQLAASATESLSRLSPQSLAQPGVVFDRARYLRSSGNSVAARQLLANAQIVAGSAGDRAQWMQGLLTLARGAMNDRQPQLAYQIAHNHGGLAFDRPLTSYSDAERDHFTSLEWLAGWAALVELGRPRDAVRHFENFAGAAKTAATRARGHYWAGKAAHAASLAVDATRNFEQAAKFPLTYYGQLASDRLGRALVVPAKLDPVVTIAERQRFDADPVVDAARLLGQVGERGRQTVVLRHLAERATTSAEEFLVSQLADAVGRADYALVASRGELADGPPAIMRFAFPELPLTPIFDHNWTMIHAITRQESRFDRNAVSHAGARGLMQLMPATARETSAKVGVDYRFDGLTADPGYNILLGSTYYRNLLDQWGGNHVLAVASYNAGAGNVRKWIAANGDPRLPGADIVKWIEQIPIFETRNYVQRVLENAVVYDRLKPARIAHGQPAALSAYLGNYNPRS
jgi:soluble lytic murein transglycosylase